MIGFIGTSLQIQLIMTARTLNSFWMNYDSCPTNILWRISEEFLATEISWTELASMRIVYRNPVEQLIVLCYSVVTGMSFLIFVAAETGSIEPLPNSGLFRHNIIYLLQ
jgi:hypothetical protein